MHANCVCLRKQDEKTKTNQDPSSSGSFTHLDRLLYGHRSRVLMVDLDMVRCEFTQHVWLDLTKAADRGGIVDDGLERVEFTITK